MFILYHQVRPASSFVDRGCFVLTEYHQLKIESSIPLPTFTSPQICLVPYLHLLYIVEWVYKHISVISRLQTMSSTLIRNLQARLSIFSHFEHRFFQNGHDVGVQLLSSISQILLVYNLEVFKQLFMTATART